MQSGVLYLLAGFGVVVVILALVFRGGTLRATLQALGAKASVEGHGASAAGRAAAPKAGVAPAPGVTASGAGSVAIGGSANDATIDAGVGRDPPAPRKR